jgi:GYF domain 2
MSDHWYYRLANQEFGPVAFEVIAELAGDGILSGADTLRRDGRKEWIRADSVVGLVLETDTEDSHAIPRDADVAEWYCRTFGSEFGPMTLADLKQMIADEQLTPDDKVRQGQRGAWLPARSCRELHSDFFLAQERQLKALREQKVEAPPAVAKQLANGKAAQRPAADEARPAPVAEPQYKKQKTTRRRAARRKANAKREEEFDAMAFLSEPAAAPAAPAPQPETPPPTTAATSTPAPTSAPTPIAAPTSAPTPIPPAAMPAAVPAAASSREYRTPTKRRRRPSFSGFSITDMFQNRKVLYGIGGVLGIAVAAFVFLKIGSAIGPDKQECFDRVTKMAEEFRAMRERKAAASEFESLQKKATKELDPVIKKLAKSPDDKSSVMLLRAAVYLRRMIVESRDTPTDAEKEFDQSLQAARKLL